jgi:hypothetical protein
MKSSRSKGLEVQMMLLHSLPFWHQTKRPGLLDSILSLMVVNWLAGWQVSRKG